MYKIETIANGYILESPDGQREHQTGIKELLQAILQFESPGSKHDEKRVYVIVAPGTDHPDFTEEHSRVIWPEDT